MFKITHPLVIPSVNLRCIKEVTNDQGGVLISCNTDRTLTDIQCSVNNEPIENCM